jgi:uncharacterized protein (DUF58 family)
MLTRQGWTVAAGAVGCLASGRLFGVPELFYLGAGAAALVIGAAALVSLTRLRLEVRRELHPPRVHAGGASRVELRVTNGARRRTPTLVLRDPVGGSRTAEVILAPLRRNETARAAYRLPTERRGILAVGPLHIDVVDPFGLARVTAPGAPVTELTVYPAVETVAPLAHTLGDDPHAGADHPTGLTLQGEDFYALRPYEVGDDLRRVHWPSTARHDELMVRQDEMPWQGRATVLLDVDRASHTPASFERAVSAAASVVMACQHRRFLVRLVTTAGEDTGFANGNAHIEAIMEQLATVQLAEGSRLPGVITSLRQPGNGGALVAVSGTLERADLDRIGRLGSVFGSVTTVMFTDRAADAPATMTRGMIVVDDTITFADAWNTARARRSGAAAGRR